MTNKTKPKPTFDTMTETQRQKVAEAFWRREAPRCQSGLVDELLRAEFDGFSIDEIENLTPDPSDWGIEKCREYVEDRVGRDSCPDPNPWAMTLIELQNFQTENGIECEPDPNQSHPEKATLLAAIIDAIDNEEVDGLKEWREAVNDNAEPEEVYEWWEVGDWLAERLHREGECVIRNGYGDWWGRCCTGQSVTLDHVIQRLGAEYCAWALDPA